LLLHSFLQTPQGNLVFFGGGILEDKQLTLGLPQDFVSNQLIAVSGGMADKRPFQTSTDGNCLFNAASIVTFGDQSKAAEFRVLACIEMLEHSDYYKRQHKTTGLHLVTRDYNEAVVDCAITFLFGLGLLSCNTSLYGRFLYAVFNGILHSTLSNGTKWSGVQVPVV
jgi:hypothetical protein